VRIAGHLNGPPAAGHGGYVAGSLAARLPGTGADAWLRAPAPLEVELQEVIGDTHVEFRDGPRLIAEADAVELEPDPVPFVPLAAAAEAATRFAGAEPNPYETCFGCGRLRDDGLQIHPGAVRGGVVACVWHSRGRIAEEWVWTALDCASGWAWAIDEVPLVTGRLTGGLLTDAALDPADPYVVVGAQLQQAGRKYLSASALFTAGGLRVAGLRATWIRTA
jgi:hypothetical protein